MNRPVLNVVGTRVALGPRTPEMLDTAVRWYNDPSSARTDNPTGVVPVTRESVEKEWQEAAKNPSTRYIPFTIYETEAWRPVGYILLHGLDIPNRTSEMGITIGTPADRGRGYGTEAVVLLLDYAFTVLSLNSVFLTTLEYNLGGQAAYRRAGFREIGRQRECSWMNGRFYDMLYMEILAEDFTSPVLARQLEWE